MIGEVLFRAIAVNSLETHTLAKDDIAYPFDISLPGVPTRSGITTVKPADTTSSAKAATFGVMPGTSCTTTTSGPDPFRKVSWVIPAAVKEPLVQPFRTFVLMSGSSPLRGPVEPNLRYPTSSWRDRFPLACPSRHADNGRTHPR